jgi:predicted metal-dependent peptidase
MMNLVDVIDAERAQGTAATDGRRIYWAPDFVKACSDEELRGLLLHETKHCAHLHLWRLPADRKGNIAGDREINLELLSIPGIALPARAIVDQSDAGLACEEIYSKLTDADESQGAQAPGAFTAPAPDDAVSNAPGAPVRPSLQDEWVRAVVQAHQVSQALGAGSGPADMERMIERLRRQRVDWRGETVEFTRAAVSTRNDWQRSARRYATAPVIYPRRRRDDLGCVIFAADVSGSIGNKVLGAFVALIEDAIAQAGCRAVVIYADDEIRAEHCVEQGAPVPPAPNCGGGTDFRPVFQRATELQAQGEHVAGIVYLTDLDGPAPEESEFATLWLSTEREAKGRFGRTVFVEA